MDSHPDLTAMLMNAAQSGITAKEAHRLIKAAWSAACPKLKTIRDTLNILADAGKITRIGGNLKIYLSNGKRRYAHWHTRYQATIVHTLQDADNWKNFHELRALLAAREGGYGGDTSLLKVALADLVARNDIEVAEVKLPCMDLARYYRCRAPISETPLCPTLTKTATDMIGRLYRQGRPRFSLTELKTALKIASNTLEQLMTHLVSEQVCCRVDGVSIPMFDALPLVTPQPIMAPRTHRRAPIQPRRALRAPSPSRAPCGLHLRRQPATPPAVQPSDTCPVSPTLNAPCSSGHSPHPRPTYPRARHQHHRPTRQPCHQRHRPAPGEARLATHLQRTGPHPRASTPPQRLWVQHLADGHHKRSEPSVGRTSPPSSGVSLSRSRPSHSLSRTGPPPHPTPAVTSRALTPAPRGPYAPHCP